MSMLQIQCELCEEVIATADSDKLTRPLYGAMFDKVDDSWDLKPFDDDIHWEWFCCPYCNHNPFALTEVQIQAHVEQKWEGPEQLKTPKGWFLIDEHRFKSDIPKHTTPLYEQDELAREWDQRLLGMDRQSQFVSRPECVCEICGRDFKSAHALNGHLRTHKGKD